MTLTGIPASGHFPDSQDQRNTVRGRFAIRSPRDSGSRAESNMTPDCPLNSMAIPCHGHSTQYGQQVLIGSISPAGEFIRHSK